MYLTIDISEVNDRRGRWSACVVKTEDVSTDDDVMAWAATGYGDTPLEAAADLFNQATAMQQRRS